MRTERSIFDRQRTREQIDADLLRRQRERASCSCEQHCRVLDDLLDRLLDERNALTCASS